MNYIIFSIILLVIVMIIIYLLSIEHNMNKIKNKGKELVCIFKSKKDYLNNKDSKNLLEYIKTRFDNNFNIVIPDKIYYQKTDKGYELNDIDIVCYENILRDHENVLKEHNYTINVLFTPINKNNCTSTYKILGQPGCFILNKQLSSCRTSLSDMTLLSEDVDTIAMIESQMLEQPK